MTGSQYANPCICGHRRGSHDRPTNVKPLACLILGCECVSFKPTDAPNETNVAQLALGRILRIASRPTREGDVTEYERCRAIILDTIKPATIDYRPDWTRDRNNGAAGD